MDNDELSLEELDMVKAGMSNSKANEEIINLINQTKDIEKLKELRKEIADSDELSEEELDHIFAGRTK